MILRSDAAKGVCVMILGAGVLTMNAAVSKIDMTLPEALSFRKVWEDLRDEFQAFMSLVPLSNAVQLVDLAGQAQQFATKLAALPPVRRRKQRPMSEHQPPDQSVAGITA